MRSARLAWPVFGLVAVLAAESCGRVAPGRAGTAIADTALIGTWHLSADDYFDSTGSLLKRDTITTGILTYSADGWMAVQIHYSAEQPRLVEPFADSALSPDDARRVIGAYEAYFGRYSVDWRDSSVSHQVQGSLRPYYIGHDRRRLFRIIEGQLLLRPADPTERWQITWQRAPR